MSGGVDSSIAAAVLKNQAYNVFGITMRILPKGIPESGDTGRAAETAEAIGISHRYIDLRDDFQELVIDDFCREYSRGRTPNPCVRCNRYIKFGALLDRAIELGADYLATGHYARREPDDCGQGYLLKKGIDPDKDQSYMLYALTRPQLARIIFPLGEFTKEEVNRTARDMNLVPPGNRESQEICFIPDNDYGVFLQTRLPEASRPGPLVDQNTGRVIGQHRGIIYYTVGQRKGLGIAAGEPRYVTAIDAASNTVFVGPKSTVYSREFTVINLNWLAIEELRYPDTMGVKIRYRHPETDALVIPDENGRVRVQMEEPQPAVTPGQSAVFYNEDTVIGGGIIDTVND
jgi:tRNA-specific 2-thiouridylase